MNMGEVLKLENVKIRSNWGVSNGKALQDCVCVTTMPCADLLASVTPESCICLQPEDDSADTNKSEITFNVQTHYIITKIKILSEARVVELYGQEEEFVKMFHSTFVDDWEGLAVYETSIDIDLSCFTIKFLKTKEDSRLWIYKIEISYKPSDKLIQSQHFNFHNLNKLIGTTELPVGAEKCKEFIQMFSTQTNLINPNLLLSLLTKRLKTSEQSESASELNEPSMSSASESSKSSASELNELKSYVDNKFKDFEKSFISYIDTKFQKLQEAQNIKLDKILELLKDKSSC